MTTPKPTLVIGDTHGVLSRLEELLLQEGVIDHCGVCGGSGDVSDAQEAVFCPPCGGSGLTRINHGVEVIQIGDLGDLMPSRTSPSADSIVFAFADRWIDVMLWGNHERPTIAPKLTFGGYEPPLPETVRYIQKWWDEGRLQLAHATHGFLITHAGLHPFVKTVTRRRTPHTLAKWINDMDTFSLAASIQVEDFVKLRDSIGWDRGGRDPHGGLLWRDVREKLYEGVRQIFGHTSHEHVCQFDTQAGISYCIDLSKNNGLGAIWLPDERVVEVIDDRTTSTSVDFAH